MIANPNLVLVDHDSAAAGVFDRRSVVVEPSVEPLTCA